MFRFSALVSAVALTCTLLITTVTALGDPQDYVICAALPAQGYLWSRATLEYPTEKAEHWFQELCSAARVDREDFEFYISRGIMNAYASNPNGRMRIVYDPALLNRLDMVHGNGWAGISVIAHELGHHVRGMNNWGSRMEAEGQADYYAGYLMYKLGASQEQAIDAIAQIADPSGRGLYPPRWERIQRIASGWAQAQSE